VTADLQLGPHYNHAFQERFTYTPPFNKQRLMALLKQIQEIYRCCWQNQAFSNIPIILSWDKNMVQAWFSAGRNVKNHDKT